MKREIRCAVKRVKRRKVIKRVNLKQNRVVRRKCTVKDKNSIVQLSPIKTASLDPKTLTENKYNIKPCSVIIRPLKLKEIAYKDTFKNELLEIKKCMVILHPLPSALCKTLRVTPPLRENIHSKNIKTKSAKNQINASKVRIRPLKVPVCNCCKEPSLNNCSVALNPLTHKTARSLSPSKILLQKLPERNAKGRKSKNAANTKSNLRKPSKRTILLRKAKVSVSLRNKQINVPKIADSKTESKRVLHLINGNSSQAVIKLNKISSGFVKITSNAHNNKPKVTPKNNWEVTNANGPSTTATQPSSPTGASRVIKRKMPELTSHTLSTAKLRVIRRKMPELASNIPKSPSNIPEPVSNIPELASNIPNTVLPRVIRKAMPGLTSNIPELASNTPNTVPPRVIKKKMPELASNNPKSVAPKRITKKKMPELASNVPNTEPSRAIKKKIPGQALNIPNTVPPPSVIAKKMPGLAPNNPNTSPPHAISKKIPGQAPNNPNTSPPRVIRKKMPGLASNIPNTSPPRVISKKIPGQAPNNPNTSPPRVTKKKIPGLASNNPNTSPPRVIRKKMRGKASNKLSTAQSRAIQKKVPKLKLIIAKDVESSSSQEMTVFTQALKATVPSSVPNRIGTRTSMTPSQGRVHKAPSKKVVRAVVKKPRVVVEEMPQFIPNVINTTVARSNQVLRRSVTPPRVIVEKMPQFISSYSSLKSSFETPSSLLAEMTPEPSPSNNAIMPSSQRHVDHEVQQSNVTLSRQLVENNVAEPRFGSTKSLSNICLPITMFNRKLATLKAQQENMSSLNRFTQSVSEHDPTGTVSNFVGISEDIENSSYSSHTSSNFGSFLSRYQELNATRNTLPSLLSSFYVPINDNRLKSDCDSECDPLPKRNKLTRSPGLQIEEISQASNATFEESEHNEPLVETEKSCQKTTPLHDDAENIQTCLIQEMDTDETGSESDKETDETSSSLSDSDESPINTPSKNVETQTEPLECYNGDADAAADSEGFAKPVSEQKALLAAWLQWTEQHEDNLLYQTF